MEAVEFLVAVSQRPPVSEEGERVWIEGLVVVGCRQDLWVIDVIRGGSREDDRGEGEKGDEDYDKTESDS